MNIFQERVPGHIGEQTVYVPVPHIMKEKLERDHGHFPGARSRAHRRADSACASDAHHEGEA